VFLGLFVVGLGVVPASDAYAAGSFTGYVGCGQGPETTPSHTCLIGDRPGAFFESTSGDVDYEVCVTFPTQRELCAPSQVAVQGVLYVNAVTTNIPGTHVVTWSVNGSQVASWSFRMVRPVRAPTIRLGDATRATRNLLHGLPTWRNRRFGFYTCIGGKVNRTEWSCRVAWVIGRRCLRGRVRVKGTVDNNEQFVHSHIVYRRTC
jgi:hypothetical protein